jgi:hypothetical protein
MKSGRNPIFRCSLFSFNMDAKHKPAEYKKKKKGKEKGKTCRGREEN